MLDENHTMVDAGYASSIRGTPRTSVARFESNLSESTMGVLHETPDVTGLRNLGVLRVASRLGVQSVGALHENSGVPYVLALTTSPPLASGEVLEFGISHAANLLRASTMGSQREVFDAPDVPRSPISTGIPLASSGMSRKESSTTVRRCLLAREIKSYAALPPDWDCDNGFAPQPRDIDNAVAFLWSLRGGDIPVPMVAGDGDVGFIWKTDSSYLEVGFCDNGQISFYGKTEGDHGVWGDDDFAEKGVSDALRTLLETIARVPQHT